MPESETRPAAAPTVRHVEGTAILTLHGEIDVLTAVPVARCLDDLTAVSCPDLVVDLRPVSFIDCSGLSVLCRARNRVRARGGRLRLVSGDGCLLRMLNATGLGDVFELHPRLPTGAGA
ncbi:STAS domain-containing protein [Streptomyces sp. NPDC005017]|uniref:STAS domain-containing protein n=1 Tax=Streptomyces sp. NPDC005017 TaxID=3364706 RepID=UPI00369FD872